MRFWFLALAFVFCSAAAQEKPSLRELLGGTSAQDEPLAPERAFQMSAAALDAKSIEVTFTPAPTYYLYRQKFDFAVLQPADARISDVRFPPGEMKEDPNFGRSEVYHNRVQATLNLAFAAAPPAAVELKVTLQGCTERGLCYPPDTRRVTVALAAAPQAQAPTTTTPMSSVPAPSATPTAVATPPATEPPTNTRAIRDWLIGVALGVGVTLLAWWRRRKRTRDIQ